MTKNCVFTHSDLDGAVTYLVLKWFYPNTNFELNIIRSAFDFRETYLSWCLNHNTSNYENIFILDLDVSGNEDLLDKPNVFIVDHHETHTSTKYTTAKAFVKKYSSACKLLYRVLSAKFPKISLTDQQKLLIGIADDYDSYSLKSPLSKPLNTLFWNLNNNFSTFCTQFYNGFNKFTPEQLSIIKIHKISYEKYKQNIKDICIGTLKFKEQEYSICSFFADKYINDLADDFFETQQTDAIIIVNLNSKKIYMRRNRNAKQGIHIGEICEKWGGGGHEGAGGGPLTADFLELSKTFKCKSL